MQIHGGLCLEAVVVTKQLDWKLSGFDLLSEHATVASYDSPLRYASRLVSIMSGLLQALLLVKIC